MELEEITSKITDLEKWRAIFSSQGLEDKKSISEEKDQKSDGKSEERGDNSSSKKHRAFLSNVLYSVPQELTIPSDLGGQPVSKEIAMELRRMLFGNTFYTFNYEWKKSFFKFRDPFSDLAYSLEAEKGGTRAIQMAVQVHIIKFLLFTKDGDEHSSLQGLHDIGSKKQEKALVTAITDILWMAGQRKGATVCLITNDSYFAESKDYKTDNFTEQLQLFEFLVKEELEKFLTVHIHCFRSEGSHGVILFLYSLLLSRTFQRLREDLDFTTTHLLHLNLGNYMAKQAIINLMLTGRASPHVFNGDQMMDDQTSEQKHGVLTRSDVGYLHWSREEVEQDRLPKVGSMLKTPKYPIWMCNINGTYSVLFGTNMSLLCDWKMEHIFELYFYSGQTTQSKTIHLTIDTHSHHWEGQYKMDEGDPEKKFPSLELTIRTKWEGAAINWNDTVPFF